MSGGGRPVSPCVNCGRPIAPGRLLCMAGPCSEPAPQDWEPTSEWAKKRRETRRTLGVARVGARPLSPAEKLAQPVAPTIRRSHG